MTSPTAPYESPADEYDRRLAERRGGAKRTIHRCFGWWLLGHACVIAAVVLLIVSLVIAVDGPEALALCTLAAGAAAAIAARSSGPFPQAAPRS